MIGVVGLGLLFVAKDMAGKAERHGVALEPRTAADWYARGDDLLKRGHDHRGAAEAYRKATELAPDMGEAHFGLGYVLLQQGDLDGATAELESALSLAREEASWRRDAESALVLAHLRKAQAPPK